MKPAKKYAWPSSHWNWPIALNHSHGTRCGEYVFTGGQASLDQEGNVLHEDNLILQCTTVVNYLKEVLSELNCDVNDLVRLVLYFVGDDTAEKLILDKTSEMLGHDVAPAINTISLPELCYPGMLIELEGVAMRGPDNKPLSRKQLRIPELSFLPAGYSHIVHCSDTVFISDLSSITKDGDVLNPDDIVAQTHTMMQQLDIALQAVGASNDHVTKLNVFYVGDGTAENWEIPARIRADCFNTPGPAATGITVPGMPLQGQMTKLAVTAMVNETNNVLSKEFSWPQGHWNWTTTLPYQHGNRCKGLIHLGGQVALDSKAMVLHPNDIVAQTQIALDNIKKVLAEFNATLQDVVKVTTFYQGTASAQDLHKNLKIRSDTFGHPGPATSGIPVPHLVYPDMQIEIEVIAVVADQ